MLITIDESLEAEFLIAICRPTGDKWQSKTLFLTILSTFVDSITVFDCRQSGLCMQMLSADNKHCALYAKR